jgi:hypothetical protein
MNHIIKAFFFYFIGLMKKKRSRRISTGVQSNEILEIEQLQERTEQVA